MIGVRNGGPDAIPGPGCDPRITSAGVDPERDRVVVEANAVDLPLRHRLAQEYGSDVVAIEWSPGAVYASLD